MAYPHAFNNPMNTSKTRTQILCELSNSGNRIPTKLKQIKDLKVGDWIVGRGEIFDVTKGPVNVYITIIDGYEFFCDEPNSLVKVLKNHEDA